MFDITMGVPEMKDFWDDLKKELRLLLLILMR